MKTALLFPGQASQYVGMAKDLYDSSASVRELYQYASDLMKTDLASVSFTGPAETLKQTRFTQPAILVHSLAVLEILKSDLPAFHFTAGHSLGEYGALVASGALTPRDAISSVVKRAELMETACQNNPGTMAATMGLSLEQIMHVCNEASKAGVVVPANINSAIQIVVSGSIAGVEKYIELAKAAGAKRAIQLEVGGAFHSPLMQSAKAGMQDFLTSITVHQIKVPIVSNVTAQATTDPSAIKGLLVDQITSPVRWSDTMSFFKQQGVTRVIEIGPGKVLAGLAKRDLEPESMINLDTLADITALTSAVA